MSSTEDAQEEGAGFVAESDFLADTGTDEDSSGLSYIWYLALITVSMGGVVVLIKRYQKEAS
jgi:hypothetical protein